MSRPTHHTDSLLTLLQVGNQSSLNNIDPGLGGDASPGKGFSPVPGDTPCDADDLGNLYWDLKTITITAFLVILVSIIVGVLTAHFLGFNWLESDAFFARDLAAIIHSFSLELRRMVCLC